jgi:hypothetical protein
MPVVACDSNSLIDAAKCFQQCIPQGMQAAVQTMLLAKITGDQRTPSELASAATCFFECIPPGEQMAVQNYLLCALLNAL